MSTDIKNYKTNIEIELNPVMWCDHIPEILVYIDSIKIYDGILNKNITVAYNGELEEKYYNLQVIFNNKTDDDCILEKNLDKAVEIKKLRINHIDCSDLLYFSEYISDKGGLRKSVTYLGWNGTWSLKFSVPVFLWIHKKKELGWIYPENF